MTGTSDASDYRRAARGAGASQAKRAIEWKLKNNGLDVRGQRAYP